MKILSQIKKRIKSRNGESITEVLVALLISMLGLVLLATMITSSAKLITQSRDAMSGYVEKGNALAAGSGSSISSGKISISLNENSYTTSVSYFINDTFSKTPVVAYYGPQTSVSSTPTGGISGSSGP